MEHSNNFRHVRRYAVECLLEDGVEHKATRWQGIKAPAPMLEVIEWSFSCAIAGDLEALRGQIHPNLPWADDHFAERVGGKSLNPGEQYKHWPYYRRNVDQHRTEEEKFTHTYMERLWPRHGADDQAWLRKIGHVIDPILGIRYEYGDLQDVVNLLYREPDTRQAFLPIWFPEDTGVNHGGRVPCTIGYWFVMRNHQLHCTYYIRSCDAVRHLRDDIYLACRKVLWMLEQLARQDRERRIMPSPNSPKAEWGVPTWSYVKPGRLTMHVGSLHCWSSERNMLKSLMCSDMRF